MANFETLDIPSTSITGSPLTSKGDLWAFNTADDRFPVSPVNGYVLMTDDTESFGFKWAPPSTSVWSRDAVSGYLYPGTLTDTVGIGINAPENTMHLHNVGAVAHALKVTNATTGTGVNTGIEFGILNDGKGYIDLYENKDFEFYVNNVNWITLKSNGQMDTRAGYDTNIVDRSLITKSYADATYSTTSITPSDLTEAVSSVLTITGGTGALLSDASIEVAQASAIQDGYLSFGDWGTFNSKQPGDATLTSLANMSADGVLCYKSASDTVYNRTLIGVSNQIDIADGSGAAGNPTFSLPEKVYLTDGLLRTYGEFGFDASNLIQFNDTGKIYIRGGGTDTIYIDTSNNVNLLAGKEFRFNDNLSVNYLGLKSPATLSGSVTLTLPDGDGSSNQVIKTDGSGNLGWADVDALAGTTNVTATSEFGADNVLIKSDGTSRGSQATGITVDDSNNISGVGSLAITSGTVSTTPSSGTDIVNYDFVIGLVGATFWNDVAVATTANVDLSTELEAGDSIDGYTLVEGDRVLVKDQTTASQNGLYVVPASGAASRASDADSASEVNDKKAIPLNGTAGGGKLFYQTNEVTTLGTDDVNFAEINCSGGTVTSISAGNGMDFTTFTDSGSIVLGTPSTLTSATSNAVTATSHTHAITTGISNTNIVKIDSADVADDEYARFTASGLESRSSAEVKQDLSLSNVENTAISTWAGSANVVTLGTITTGTWNAGIIAHEYGGLEANVSAYNGLIQISGGATSARTVGIADDNIVEVDDVLISAGEYAKWTANGLEGVTTATVLSDIGGAPAGNYITDEDFNPTAGIMTTDGAGTYASRTITGTANEIEVANGDGSGDPTISLPDEVYGGASFKIGRDADNFIDFSVDNKITLHVDTEDTADVEYDGISFKASKKLFFYDSDSSNRVSFELDADLTGDVQFKVPTADGSNNYFMITDGSGQLSFTPQRVTKSIHLASTDTALSVVDTIGKVFWAVPAEYDGWTLIGVQADVYTASTSGLPTFQIEKDGADILTTKITIDATEKTSATATTPPVINASYETLATGEQFTFDCDVAGTSTEGLTITLTLEK